jgi:hypothetical protein
MKKHLLKDFIKFEVTYLNAVGSLRVWEGYAEINSNYNLRIFNPHFKVSECQRRHFYLKKLTPWGNHLTDDRYIYDEDIVIALTDKLTELGFWGMRFYEEPLAIIIYSKYAGEWKQADTFRFLHSKGYMETVFVDSKVKEIHPNGEVLKEKDDYVASLGS